MEEQIERINKIFPDLLADCEGAPEILEETLYCHVEDAPSKLCRELENTLNQSIDSSAMTGKVRMTSKSLVISFRDSATNYSIPLSDKAAARLYKSLPRSLVGVERRGDVLDPDIRKSHEVEVSELHLPPLLHDFDFPEEKERIRLHLCPSAVDLRIVPYKLIIYGEGDFFSAHRDSMNEASMIGSISLILPVGDKEVAPLNYTALDRFEEWPGLHSGELMLYAGYAADSSEESEDDHLPDSISYAVNMHRPFTELDNSGKKVMVMNYGAWTGDTLHEVLPVSSGFRASIIYRLYKVGHRDLLIPPQLRASVEEKICSLFKELTLRGNTKYEITYLGFALRHAYPVGGLHPHALKGIDAILYSIISPHYAFCLFTGHEMRRAKFKVKHYIIPNLYKKLVFVTNDIPRLDYGEEEVTEKMVYQYPMIQNTLWVQLGYGKLLGGGFCYGNCDCGTDWWYRQAYMVISSRLGWKRRLCNLLLLIKRGPREWSRLDGKQDLLEQIIAFL